MFWVDARLAGVRPEGLHRADRAPAACLLTGVRPDIDRSSSAIATFDIVSSARLPGSAKRHDVENGTSAGGD